jgi:GntR family transcriptional regulator of vanillate catabolism
VDEMERLKKRAKHENYPESFESHSQTTAAILRLRELLLRGEFKPGQRMAEIPLAKRLRVSRTPLRLALITLEHEGLLEVHPTRGYVTRAFTLKDVFDSIELRGVLEGTAARFAAERLSDGQVAQHTLKLMKEICVQLDNLLISKKFDVTKLERYIEWNEQFHGFLLRLAQSDVLKREIDRVCSLPFASPSGFVSVQAKTPECLSLIRISQDQHHAVTEAIEQRQGSRAESLMREHSRIASRNLEIAINSHSIRHLVPGAFLIEDINANRELRRSNALVKALYLDRTNIAPEARELRDCS